jgi:hypothetical protein
MYAQHKLNEAQFFWDKVKASPAGSNENPFYFSAFFSAFRSITFVMQSQYKHRTGYDSVYGRVLCHMRSNGLFGDLKEARNIALKEGAKVPALITKFKNDVTGDAIVYECDPLPTSENVIRNVSVEFGLREQWLYPSDMPEQERKDRYMSQLWHVLKEFQSAKGQVEHLVRIAPGGAHVSLGELAVVVDSSLVFLQSILHEFESLPANTNMGIPDAGT